ncbi:hypothetical protein MRB53_040892 [Persea americana]|nr:hypothetical protein MRB53_040892 [Persea americana]
MPIMYLEDGAGIFQNPGYASPFSGQSISFLDSTGILHMDTQVYSHNSNFGAQIYGFGNGNMLEFLDIISSFTYSASAGALTVKFLTGNSVVLKIGTGYLAAGFKQKTSSTFYNLLGYNAIYYSGAAPSGASAGSAPSQCQLTAPICSSLSNYQIPAAVSSTQTVVGPATGSTTSSGVLVVTVTPTTTFTVTGPATGLTTSGQAVYTTVQQQITKTVTVVGPVAGSSTSSGILYTTATPTTTSTVTGPATGLSTSGQVVVTTVLPVISQTVTVVGPVAGSTTSSGTLIVTAHADDHDHSYWTSDRLDYYRLHGHHDCTSGCIANHQDNHHRWTVITTALPIANQVTLTTTIAGPVPGTTTSSGVVVITAKPTTTVTATGPVTGLTTTGLTVITTVTPVNLVTFTTTQVGPSAGSTISSGVLIITATPTTTVTVTGPATGLTTTGFTVITTATAGPVNPTTTSYTSGAVAGTTTSGAVVVVTTTVSPAGTSINGGVVVITTTNAIAPTATSYTSGAVAGTTTSGEIVVITTTAAAAGTPTTTSYTTGPMAGSTTSSGVLIVTTLASSTSSGVPCVTPTQVAIDVPGYTQEWSGLTAAADGAGYLAVSIFQVYDVASCAAACSSSSVCVFFNIYQEQLGCNSYDYVCVQWAQDKPVSQATNSVNGGRPISYSAGYFKNSTGSSSSSAGSTSAASSTASSGSSSANAGSNTVSASTNTAVIGTATATTAASSTSAAQTGCPAVTSSTPTGYSLEWNGQTAAANCAGYIYSYVMPDYDAASCAATCTSESNCVFFNIYQDLVNGAYENVCVTWSQDQPFSSCGTNTYNNGKPICNSNGYSKSGSGSVSSTNTASSTGAATGNPGTLPVQTGTSTNTGASSGAVTSTTAASATSSPSGYTLEWTSANAATGSGYISYSHIPSYDAGTCAAQCDANSACVFFDMYQETDSAGNVLYTCVLWSQDKPVSTATNSGSGGSTFSNAQGWVKNSSSSTSSAAGSADLTATGTGATSSGTASATATSANTATGTVGTATSTATSPAVTGYTLEWSNQPGAATCQGYLSAYVLASRNPTACAASCSNDSRCIFFNIYDEATSPTTTDTVCALWSQDQAVTCASNSYNGGKQVSGSDGYLLSSYASASSSSATSSLGPASTCACSA